MLNEFGKINFTEVNFLSSVSSIDNIKRSEIMDESLFDKQFYFIDFARERSL